MSISRTDPTVTGAHLGNVRELPAGEVNEGQVTETQWDGGIILDEGAPGRVGGKLLVNDGVMTQQTSVSAESDAAHLTPSGGDNREIIVPDSRVSLQGHCNYDSNPPH